MILGIESTAHTFGVGVCKEKRILSNKKDMYVTDSGGIVTSASAAHHSTASERIYQEALKEAKIDEKDIEAIAYSSGPGLSLCLLAGLKFAKEKATKLKIPLIPVNHCVAHLEIAKITGARDPVLLYTSGANTQIIAFVSGKYRVFGETLDIGVGNFLDKFARHTGLGFPGGPKIELLARKGKYIELPYSIKGMDVSFSGIQTKLQQLYDKGEKIEDLSFSMQETGFAMLVEAAERAMAHTGKKELALGGGVACNERLQKMCSLMCKERKAKFFCPPKSLLTDNGAMIAYLGEIMFNAGIKIPPNKADINPRERTDDVAVGWRA